jgi:tetratricopeptide (TPR) repeat protein
VKRAAAVMAALATIVVAIASAYRLCFVRYRCDLRSAAAENALTLLVAAPQEMRARITAREISDEMAGCIDAWPTNTNLYMIRAAALRVLGRGDDAVLEYRRALHVDRRAELYLNIGMTEMEAGRNEQAADALATAVYLNYAYLDEIGEPMRSRVRGEVLPNLEMLRRKKAPRSFVDELRARVTRDPL